MARVVVQLPKRGCVLDMHRAKEADRCLMKRRVRDVVSLLQSPQAMDGLMNDMVRCLTVGSLSHVDGRSSTRDRHDDVRVQYLEV